MSGFEPPDVYAVTTEPPLLPLWCYFKQVFSQEYAFFFFEKQSNGNYTVLSIWFKTLRWAFETVQQLTAPADKPYKTFECCPHPARWNERTISESPLISTCAPPLHE